MIDLIVLEKTCSDCKQSKPLGDFYPSKRLKFGVLSSCKACVSQRSKGYREAAKRKPRMTSPSFRICRTCRIEKPITEFYQSKARTDPTFTECKVCHKTRTKQVRQRNLTATRERERRYRLKATANTKESIRRYYRSEKGKRTIYSRYYQKRFGITLQEYEARLEAHNGVCAICLKPQKDKRRLVVDHNHQTGDVRGLLCTPCNIILGCWQDNSGTALRAATYLEHHRSLSPTVTSIPAAREMIVSSPLTTS